MSSCINNYEYTGVQRPYQYVGFEENAYNKSFDDASLRFCLAFPDSYEVGMSNLGIQIIYHIINEQADLMADRVFAPLEDMAELMRKKSILLSGRESNKPLRSFDCLGFSLQYELSYTNLLYMLDLAGIPLLSKDRNDDDPLVTAGGPCVFNVEPVADFLDFAVLGEGEDVVLEVADCLIGAKEKKLNRKQTLIALSKIKGVYVPSLYVPKYSAEGRFEKLERLFLAPRFVERRIIKDLDKAKYPTAPVTPSVRPVHERVAVEVQRGCTRSCRFCQAGYVYRPRRERNPQTVVNLIEESVKNTGIYDIGLLSLSTADYSQLHPVMKHIMTKYKKEHLNIGMPSTRLEALKVEYLDVLKEERRSGFTIAPEAGSQRMRNVINKNFTDEEIIATAKLLFENGWQHIKMYFMIGLPTETDDDVIAIAEIGNKVFRATSSIPGRKQLTISVSNFVPKPHTPFQWHEQISYEETIRKQKLIKESIQFPKNISLRTHNPNNSFVEGIIARGSRLHGALILRAYQLGARFDCWQERLNVGIWRNAAKQLLDETGIDLINEGHRARSFEERLPWHRLYSGIHPKFFKNEYSKAVLGHATEDCSFSSCHACGLCNEHTDVAPTLSAKDSGKELLEKSSALPLLTQELLELKGRIVLRIQYQKLGAAVLLSNLEIQKSLQRAFKRANIFLAYDKGMRPRPKLSMGPALSVGVSSSCELFDIEIYGQHEVSELIGAVNQYLPQDLRLKTGTIIDESYRSIQESIKTQSYQATFNPMDEAEFSELWSQFQSFMASNKHVISRERKSKNVHIRTSLIDIRPFVKSMDISKFVDSKTQKLTPVLRYTLLSDSGQSINPFLILSPFVKVDAEARRIPIEKLGIDLIN